MATVVLYTKAHCPYCDFAKELLHSKKASFEEIRIDLHPNKRTEMETRSGRRTVPQIFINDQPIGGFDDLSQLAKSGKLDELLK